MNITKKAIDWYGRYERPLSSLSLIAGFVFDALTLKRVDTLFENIWILGHLVVVGIFIFLVHLKEIEEGDEANPSKIHFWYVNILQFFFGGTLSAYVVFYFRSTEFSATWPFILLLSLAFIANESLKRHYVRLSFQISLFFLSIYSFLIFFLPIILHSIGTKVFLLGGAISLLTISIFTGLLFYLIKHKKKEETESKRFIAFTIITIFGIVNVLYFTNLIPPIPLSLKEGGVYHSVNKVSGDYLVSYEDSSGWKDYFKIYPDFKIAPGEPAYVFSAIFSPKDLDITVVHRWQYYDETKNKWITKSIVKLPVAGGRERGFRTYSMKSSLDQGKWRVNIETEQGLIIGRVRFSAVDSGSIENLKEKFI